MFPYSISSSIRRWGRLGGAAIFGFQGVSSGGGSISGQFYGSHHEDVMGNFMYDTLTGAWGASRMTTGPGAGGDDVDGGGDMDGDMDGDG